MESVTINSPANEVQIQEKYQVKEILMVGLGNNGSRPLLFVRLDRDLYIYEVFRFSRGNLKLRFKKLKHNMIYSPNQEGSLETENSDFFAIQERISRIRYFDNISSKSIIYYLSHTSLYLTVISITSIFLSSRNLS